MSLALWFYLVNVVGTLKCYFVVGSIIGAVTLIAVLIWGSSFMDNTPSDTELKQWFRWFKGSLLLLAGSFLLGVLIPSEKTAYLIMGAQATQEIAQNPKIQETGQKILNVINHKLDELADMEEVKQKEKK